MAQKLHLGWGKVYDRKFNKKENRYKGTIEYTDAFAAYLGIEDSPYKKICYGSFAGKTEEEYEENKAKVIRKFNIHAKQMEENIGTKGWTMIGVYKGMALCPYHFWDRTDLWDRWMSRMEDCRLCDKEEKDKEDEINWNSYFRHLEKDQPELVQAHKWMINNVMPPNGKRDWTPEMLKELTK